MDEEVGELGEYSCIYKSGYEERFDLVGEGLGEVFWLKVEMCRKYNVVCEEENNVEDVKEDVDVFNLVGIILNCVES